MNKRIASLLMFLTAAMLCAGEFKLFDDLRLPPDKIRETTKVTLPAVPVDQKPILCFIGRLQNYGISGYTQALHIRVNGELVTGDCLLNKPLRPRTAEGALEVYIAKHGYLLPYSNDFSSANRPDSPIQKTLEPYDFYGFELDLSDFVKAGNNTVEFIARSPLKTDVVLSQISIKFKSIKDLKTKGAAPTGELPLMVPEIPETNAIQIQNSENPLALVHNGRTWKIVSRFSTPDGKWVDGSNAFFWHEREVKLLPEMTLVRDTYTNLTNEQLPIMQRHEITFASKDSAFMLGGMERKAGKIEGKFNCTSYGGVAGCGLGMYPMNSEFQAHACNYITNDNVLGLADNQMVLPAKGKVTQSFVVVPTKRADYWQFVNAIRRQIGANFTLEGTQATFAPVWKDADWPDDKIRQLTEAKSVSIFVLDTYGLLQHGEFAQFGEQLDKLREAIARFRRLFPDKKLLMYFHSQLFSGSSDATPYASDLVRDKDGKELKYYGGGDKIVLTTLENNTGRLFEARLKTFMDMGVDGIFWDETGYSMIPYHYGAPWDGISGDIDPETHQLIRLKSSVMLLQQPWKMKMMRMLRERKMYIQGNCTLSGEMLSLRFPTMTETDVLENCSDMALWSPLQYGDYTSSQDSLVSMCRAMHRGLNYGCLYIWPHMSLPRLKSPSDHHKTLASYMFPTTPIELRKGIVFARERILTNRSGLFGWDDASAHEVHVFDDKGREQTDFHAPLVTRNGKNYTEIRIPEDWAAAIIRHHQY